jgi:hypothetical protein
MSRYSTGFYTKGDDREINRKFTEIIENHSVEAKETNIQCDQNKTKAVKNKVMSFRIQL